MNNPNQGLSEVKRLETVLMFQRWLYVPAVLLAAFLYDWLYPPVVAAVVGMLISANIAARYFYRRDLSPRQQSLVSLGLLAVDILAAFLMIIAGIRLGHTSVYIIFTPMIVEAAIRFGLKGSLIADIIFALAFFGIRQYGLSVWSVQYPLADYVLTIGVMSFVSLMVGMVAREWKRHRRQAEQLAAERASLLERRRISNELHDSVLKSLEGLALETHAARERKPDEVVLLANEQSLYIENVCRQISREIRGVIFEMREETSPKNVTELVRKTAEKWQKENGAEIIFTHNESAEVLPRRLAHDIQKLLEEALTNVKRHAHASQINLSLNTEGRLLTITIHDNGCGFQADLQGIYAFARQGKLGLITMKERIEMAGGSLNIESGPRGTNVTARVPIPDSTDQAGKQS